MTRVQTEVVRLPYCPKCRSEFVDGTTVCSECGVALVDELPAGTPRVEDSEDLVEVWRTQGEVNAQLAKSLLEGSGVASMLSGESLRLTHGLTIDGLALVHVLVRPSDVGRACEIIASTEGVRQCPRCDFPVPESDETCWSCGARFER
jgi:predicted amidophosphoribosyltransferase